MTATVTGVEREDQLLAATSTVEFVIPVYNEEVDLAASVLRLDHALATSFPYEYRITIADNASTDDTWAIAQGLTRDVATVQAIHLDQKGRGRALKQVWLASQADVVAYMDVDLSTDLKAVLPLIAPLVTGHSDIAIGTRLAKASQVVRGPKREFISRTYNLILRGTLQVGFSDAQCGFKAIRTDVAQDLLPLVEDNNWFFDTEMLVLAQRAGLRIHEVPVDWTDDPGSTVNIVATATEDLRGIWRLLAGLTRGTIPLAQVRAHLNRGIPAQPEATGGLMGQLLRFGLVGVASTLAYFVLYLLLREPVGAQVANFVALLLTAMANTAANRRVTFGIRGSQGALTHQVGGLIAFGLALALTSGSLWSLHTFAPAAGRGIEVFVLVIANATATLMRFLALRLMMYRPAHSERASLHG